MEAGRYLIDEYQVGYLTVGRDVMRFGIGLGIGPGQSIVAAAPDFDLSLSSAPSELREPPAAGQQSRSLDLRSLKGSSPESVMARELLWMLKLASGRGFREAC